MSKPCPWIFSNLGTFSRSFLWAMPSDDSDHPDDVLEVAGGFFVFFVVTLEEVFVFLLPPSP